MPSSVHQELGLTDEEYEAITERLGRDPSYTELAMFSVMWSEHCSYKSSRMYLRDLPTEGDHVLVGPGEGAGIVEVAPGVAVAWKIESHNHPSFVEPFSGAATGVGGIVRDILSMGARPIALLDSLRFGTLDDAKTRYIVEGVVSGISSYGNSIGVPTVGGETIFEACYAENPLVNVACLGIVEGDLMQGRATGVGNQVILFGSRTGRDGIGGASVLASAEFDDSSHTKRPAVQVGDPFAEKLLIEASLQMINEGLLAGLQDLGAGGISCPTSEMTSKAGTGMRVDLDQVHLREAGMEPFEIMISESQERMMAVVEPPRVARVLEICDRWGIEAEVIGEVTKTGRVEVSNAGAIVADAPADSLTEEAPLYERPREVPAWLEDVRSAPVGDDPPDSLGEALLELLGSPGTASKRWVWEQYDHMIFLGTVQGPGGDAAVIRLPDTDVAVALSVDGPGRYCYLDPYEGARLAVAEAARNVACTGATPLAVTNCLNFGSPEKPGVMWQFAEAVRGIGDACRFLRTPVVGGNVSFYNETAGRAIYPTPVIGMLGSMPDAAGAVGSAFTTERDPIVLIGTTDPNDMGGSEYGAVINGAVGGLPPKLDIDAEVALLGFLQRSSAAGLLHSAHDPAVGGIAVALAESAIAGGIGYRVAIEGAAQHLVCFSESPSRVLVTCSETDLDKVLALATEASLASAVLGHVGGRDLDHSSFSIGLEDAVAVHRRGLPERMTASTVAG